MPFARFPSHLACPADDTLFAIGTTAQRMAASPRFRHHIRDTFYRTLHSKYLVASRTADASITSQLSSGHRHLPWAQSRASEDRWLPLFDIGFDKGTSFVTYTRKLDHPSG